MRMVLYSFSVLLFVACSHYSSQENYFIVSRIETSPTIVTFLKSIDSTYNDYDNLFKILPEDNITDYNKLNYPLKLRGDIDTLSAVKLLLEMQGDKRICIVPVMSYDPASSKILQNIHNHYSIQVEALFLINQIIFDKPFKYSSVPVLIDRETGRTESIEGDIVDRAYESYNNWYKIVRERGLEHAKNDGLNPLDGSGVRWY